MSVATKQLGWNNAVGTTQVTLYTCPSGHRTIVKSLVVRNGAVGSNILAVAILSGGVVAGAMRLYLAAGGTNGDTELLQPWMVMEAGDALIAQATAASVVVFASGAELTL